MQSLSNPGLWNRLQNYNIDNTQSACSLSNRLAAENSWSPGFTQQAIEEYKKFAYLACISSTPVTPSDEVDQVWHVHLTYTRTYWEKFCGQILQKDLHHEPTRGGQQENTKFRDWYEKTRQLYEKEFGAPPPEELWPPSHIRFTRPRHMKRVDLSSHWLLPRLKISSPGRLITTITIPSVLSGCTVSMFGRNFELYAWHVAIVVFLILGIIAYFLVPLVENEDPALPDSKEKDTSASGGGGCGSDDSSGCGSGCGGGD